MTDLKERLRADLTDAMRSRDQVRLRTLRMALASITNEEVSGTAHELSDDDVLKVLTREAKKRREAAEAFAAAGRADQAEAERAEGDVLAGVPARAAVRRGPDRPGDGGHRRDRRGRDARHGEGHEGGHARRWRAGPTGRGWPPRCAASSARARPGSSRRRLRSLADGRRRSGAYHLVGQDRPLSTQLGARQPVTGRRRGRLRAVDPAVAVVPGAARRLRGLGRRALVQRLEYRAAAVAAAAAASCHRPRRRGRRRRGRRWRRRYRSAVAVPALLGLLRRLLNRLAVALAPQGTALAAPG